MNNVSPKIALQMFWKKVPSLPYMYIFAMGKSHNFSHKYFIYQPILIFVALCMNFGMQKDNKIKFVQ